MYQGFYNLASNMITQNRNMNVISNNMANVSTPGFKSDKLVESTFREEMLYRYDRSGKTPIGVSARINTADERVTNYSEGALRETGSPLDFALKGNGFFAVRTAEGTVYSRNGSFAVDAEGYLTLPGVGRVLGENGEIRVNTDKLALDANGNLVSEDGTENYGRFLIVDFADYNGLTKITGGVFRSNTAGQQADAVVTNKCIEESNVSMVDEMTAMMSGQRTLQSSSQLLKMYDALTGKAVQLGSM